MADFKVAERPIFRISEVDLKWVMGIAHGGYVLDEGGDKILLEDGSYLLLDDPEQKSYIFRVAERPTFKVDDGR